MHKPWNWDPEAQAVLRMSPHSLDSRSGAELGGCRGAGGPDPSGSTLASRASPSQGPGAPREHEEVGFSIRRRKQGRGPAKVLRSP